MATLTREATDAATRRPAQSRTERLRAKAAAITSDGEYRIGDRLRSRVNPEIEWTVGGFVENGLTIISPSGQRHDVDMPIIRTRFINLRIDAESTAAPVWASDAEIEAFEQSEAGKALRDAEYAQSAGDTAPVEAPDKPETVAIAPGRRVRSIECSVSRKVARDYNSTAYHAGVVMDVDESCDVAQVAAETYDMLRQIIRHEFSKQNGNGKGN